MPGENFRPKIARIFVGPLGLLFGGVFATFSDQRTEKRVGFPIFSVPKDPLRAGCFFFFFPDMVQAASPQEVFWDNKK